MLCVQGVWIITSPFPLVEWFIMQFKTDKLVGFIINTSAVVIFLVQIFGVPIFPLPHTSFDIPMTLLGLILSLLGASLAIWARVTMGKIWGLPKQHDFKRQNKLIVNGPYEYTRNPIYVGLIIIYIGFELTLHSFLILAVLIPVIKFYQAIITEEKLLVKYFGKNYLLYKAKVPRII